MGEGAAYLFEHSEAVCGKGIVMPDFNIWFRNCCLNTSRFVRKDVSVLSLSYLHLSRLDKC